MISPAILIPASAAIMLIGAFGAYFFKRASKRISLHPIKLLKNTDFLLAGTLYVLSSVGYVLLLQHVPLTIMYPLTSLTYVWVAFIGRWLLKEQLTKQKLAGVGLIIIGIIVLTAIP